MEIGVCGIGGMGAALVGRLLDQGKHPLLWNRNRDKLTPFLALGGKPAATPAALAQASDIVLTILLDEAALAAVFDGADGFLAGEIAGKLFIEMSTVLPATHRALETRLHAKGARLLECPVGGTVGPARKGELLGFAGGTAEDFARARPVLNLLCRRVDLLGPMGAGATMKLAVNLPLALYWEALGEALSLCRDTGIAPDMMIEILRDSSGGANVMRGSRGAAILATLKTGEIGDEPGFHVEGLCKDLRLMLALAAEMGFTLPLVDTALVGYEAAAQAGWGKRENSALAIYRLRQAGRP